VVPLHPLPARPGPPDFAQVFRDFAPYVHGVAARLLGRDGDVEDLVHDTFLEALRTLPGLQDPTRVRPFLASITVRLALRRLRRQRLWQAFGLAEPWHPTLLSTPGASAEDRLLLAQVYRVLDRLPADQRVAWSLRYLEGEKLEDVAQLCDCSLATAKRRIAAVQLAVEEAVNHG
jgi:RNA polymerase sigma-70 factor, ECF subfamily